MVKPPALCIFDLDGTLVDSLRDIAEAFNQAMELLGLPTRPVDQYRRMVGEGIVRLSERVVGADRPHLVGRLVELARPRYRLRPLMHTTPFAGIPEVIGQLRTAGVRLAVLSNKPDEMTNIIVREFWPDGAFSHILGYRPDRRLKPDPAALLSICDDLGVSPNATWYIGDTPTDIETARRANAISIGVTWGYRSKGDLADAGADYLIDSPAELAAAILCGLSD